MSNGHCRHCDSERPGLCYESKEFGLVHVSTESGEWHAHWVDGHCPLCAEREQIATFVEQLPVMTSYHAPDARNLAYRYTSPVMVAARIRGEA